MFNIKKFRTNLFIKELILFLMVQILGIYIVFKNIVNPQDSIFSSKKLTFYWIDVAVLIAMILIFLIFARHPGRTRNIFFKTLFVLVIFTGSQLALASFLPASMVSIISILLVIVFIFFNFVAFHNLVMVLTCAGIGALLATSVSITTAIVLLVILSFYDIWAVYRTGHMVVLAEGMIQAGAISGFVIPERSVDFLARPGNVVPGERAMILGSGDILFPLLLEGAVASYSVGAAIVVMIFAAIGLLITHLLFFNQPKRMPMAALPPIATMTILGYIISMGLGF